ncbi:uncharacterized protein BDR25DRAFT_314810 [Lindgomyces ingoldianus]|uniref:Uncharacterized protein n=1 Tax=Lindgomyces ingoldianus TaxID=673940 RepID=A0ACB6QSR2_9PLEO|nr:uncharacterized protein BDR25DRAFT_314810 [Lindgomyces ingoldianus]KAF2470059.1 hypothetical protein BDR25DRAFT_314810 [Lindgomyces ingoldianus]
MSFKAKNLAYEAQQPAFLRRLRGEVAGDDSVRHEQPIPRNKRMKQDDDDDGPTYVLEDSNQSLSKAEYEALVTNKDPESLTGKTDKSLQPDLALEGGDKGESKDRIVEAGQTMRKRKAVRVGGDEPEEGKLLKVKDAKVVKKPKKKAKPIKLSFGDQEEG